MLAILAWERKKCNLARMIGWAAKMAAKGVRTPFTDSD